MFIVGILAGLFIAGGILFVSGFVIKKREKTLSLGVVTLGNKTKPEDIEDVNENNDKLEDDK